mgnify:FL=1
MRLNHLLRLVALPALLLLGALAAAPLQAQGVARARLAIIGGVDMALFGQNGYCGAMETYDKADTGGVLIDAERPLWLRLRWDGLFRNKCVGDFSFLPEPGRAYILRLSTPERPCRLELFRVNPGQAPTPTPLRGEEHRSCLLPWNHDGAPEAASSSRAGLP